MKRTFFTILLWATLGTSLAGAYVSGSTNYRIQFDSVNVGGALSTSTNFNIEDTTGEVGTGELSSLTYKVRAGYQQMNETYLAITSPADVTLSPSIPGPSGGIANGSATWTVTTDNAAGYTMTIKASSSPALNSGGNSFADYTPTGASPDFTFSIANTDSEFGFSPEGTDITSRYKDDGSACNTGLSDASDRCWDPLSTSNTTIANRTSGTHPDGTTLTVKFRAESGTSHTQAAGTYTATTTVTVTSL